MKVPARFLSSLLVCAGAAHAACPLPAGVSPSLSAGPVQASWSTEPARLEVGEPFVMRLTLCPADTRLLRVGATMPEHRHGMNYEPSFQSLGEGVWRVEGMVWHMSGRWELRLDTQLQGEPFTLTQSVNLQ